MLLKPHKVFIMGSSSGKVLPESSSSKRGYFCLFNSIVIFNKQESEGEKCVEKQQTGLWKKRSDGGASGEELHLEENIENRNAKFRAKFDPRVTARYEIQALIGRGSFSRVVRAEHKQTHQPFAIKLLDLRAPEGLESCQAELRVLRRVNHPNIIRLTEVFQTPHRVYLVLELATGGELLERVLSRGTFRERDATKALLMVTSGLAYLHNLGVIHRDLKPENLLYYHPGQDSRLIITDFGLACWDKSIQRDDLELTVGLEEKGWALRTLCGTPEYLAPEMLARRGCGRAVDMWALGIITYVLLSGSLPFDHSSRAKLFRAILKGSYSFHGEPWRSVSSLGKGFINGLLTVVPEQRMSAEEALHHPWLVNMAACSSNKNLQRSISRNLQRRASRTSSRCPSSASGSQASRSSSSRLGLRNGSRCQNISTVSEGLVC
nr:serine/threonine-protein kinase H2 [Danio rerio]|eukprot:XP_009305164.3 serine/threonine-protein kinase H2 [Danio rerio]